VDDIKWNPLGLGSFALYALKTPKINMFGKNGARVGRRQPYWTRLPITDCFHGWNTNLVFPSMGLITLHAATVILQENGGEMGICQPKKTGNIN